MEPIAIAALTGFGVVLCVFGCLCRMKVSTLKVSKSETHLSSLGPSEDEFDDFSSKPKSSATNFGS
jgi:hypothetical protein